LRLRSGYCLGWNQKQCITVGNPPAAGKWAIREHLQAHCKNTGNIRRVPKSFGRCQQRCGPSLPVLQQLVRLIIAKFHYTGPTGPARNRTDPHGLCRRPARTQRSFAAKKVRAGPCGSGRVRVVEFSYKLTSSMDWPDVVQRTRAPLKFTASIHRVA